VRSNYRPGNGRGRESGKCLLSVTYFIIVKVLYGNSTKVLYDDVLYKTIVMTKRVSREGGNLQDSSNLKSDFALV
jgi:hypothetical protein